ncbi:protein WFDC9 [Elephas maximus indicus]|uniref:protein WFDC9 n=1 Tax=Elephas maximus indicus TaxID=99487 RepID=UPI00054061AD|nr:protein WFDC9 [Elephas maximus indicus]
MKLQVLLVIMLASVVVRILPVLGGVRKKYTSKTLEIEQCWVQPPLEFCDKKCSKYNFCVFYNHTCCWTYCGNICLHNEEPFKSMLKP